MEEDARERERKGKGDGTRAKPRDDSIAKKGRDGNVDRMRWKRDKKGGRVASRREKSTGNVASETEDQSRERNPDEARE